MSGESSDRTRLHPDAQHRIVKTFDAAGTSLPEHEVIYLDSSTAGFALTLPHVSEMTGKFVCISLVKGATNAVTIVTPGDAQTLVSAKTLDATLDRLLAYCDGMTWYLVVNIVA